MVSEIPVEAAREAGFYSAGSILRFSWDPNSLFTRGMDTDGVAFVSHASHASLSRCYVGKSKAVAGGKFGDGVVAILGSQSKKHRSDNQES